VFSNGSSSGFSFVAQGGVVTKTGAGSSLFFFTGDADSSIGSSAATISFAIFIAENGVDFTEVTRFTSPQTFSSNENGKAVGTNGVTPTVMPQNAKAKVMVKSSSAGVVIDHQTVNFTAMEV
jgi:hypothetical protein